MHVAKLPSNKSYRLTLMWGGIFKRVPPTSPTVAAAPERPMVAEAPLLHPGWRPGSPMTRPLSCPSQVFQDRQAPLRPTQPTPLPRGLEVTLAPLTSLPE